MKVMKYFFSSTLFLFISELCFAQAPQRFSYQAVIYDAQNNLVINKTVGAKISICAVDPNSSPIYVETQTPTTNDNGLATMQIGTGTVVPANKRIPFANINWATGDYYIRVKVDPTGGTNYELITVTTRINSVPYALYSQTTGTAGVKGATGAQGVDGQNGVDGTNGTNGNDGKTILYGTTNPTSLIGHNGDFYLNTASQVFFGPKTNGAWNNGISLSGNTILNDTIDPLSILGKDGDFYINTRTKTLFGPRKNGTWSITAGNFPKGQNAGDIYYWNGTTWTILSKGTDGKQLMVINGKPTWGPLLATVSMTYNATSHTKFTLSGNVSSDGGSAVTARGFCWSNSNTPNVFSDTIFCGAGLGTFSATFNLDTNLSYVRAFAINSGDQGIAYSTLQKITKPYFINDIGPAGGFVFYDKGFYSDGWRYLECPTLDKLPNHEVHWGAYGMVATDTSLGSGKQNTINIIKNTPMTGEYAAKNCDDYSQNGFDDWFLPSYREMEILFPFLTRELVQYHDWFWTSSTDDNFPSYIGTLAFVKFRYEQDRWYDEEERIRNEDRSIRYGVAVPIRSF